MLAPITVPSIAPPFISAVAIVPVVKVPAAAVLAPIIVLSKLDIVKLLKVPAAGVVPPIVTPSIVPPSKATPHRGWSFSSCKAYKA